MLSVGISSRTSGSGGPWIASSRVTIRSALTDAVPKGVAFTVAVSMEAEALNVDCVLLAGSTSALNASVLAACEVV